MNEDRLENRECELGIYIFHNGIVKSSYDAKAGLLREFVLLGRIYDDYRDSTFHNKQVRLIIYSKPHEGWLEQIRVHFMGGKGDPCGVVRVNAGLESKRFEDVEIEPVHIELFLNPDAFESIHRQAVEAYDHHLIMFTRLTLIGGALHSIARDESMPLTIAPRELDISVFNGYGVKSFEITTTQSLHRLHGRVPKVWPERGEKYGTEISILLTEAHYETNFERGVINSISCEGYVKHVRGEGKHWAGTPVTITFKEYEQNRQIEMHKSQFFGEFRYLPKEPPLLCLELHYVSEDARKLIIPIISQQGANMVALEILVTNSEEDLFTTTDELRGGVRDYKFIVTRRDFMQGAVQERN